MIKAVASVGFQIPGYKVRIANPDQPTQSNVCAYPEERDYKSDPAALNNIGAHPEEQG